MLRCLSCNGILTKSEAKCYSCGEVSPGQPNKKVRGNGLTMVATVAFYLSIGITIFSLFSDHAPPVALCLPVTLVLMFVKSSADQIKKNRA